MSVRSTEPMPRPFPANCAKSDTILAELLEYLVDHQTEDGSFGNPVHNAFAPVGTAGERRREVSAGRRTQRAISLSLRPVAKDERYFDLINWTYMSAAIVLSEYYLATGEKWVLPELQEVHDHLAQEPVSPHVADQSQSEEIAPGFVSQRAERFSRRLGAQSRL